MVYILPDWVSIYKEKGKSIKVKNCKYYLFEHKTVYDNTKKYNHYSKDTYIGRITEDRGLIPARKVVTTKPENLCVKDYGTYALFNLVGNEILERLKKYFNEYADLIFTIACLRAETNTPYYELEDAFEENFFSTVYKTLFFSKSSLSAFLEKLSLFKTNMISFMKEDITKDDTIIFDGTNILCGSQNISYSAAGYQHGHNYKTQVNELYVYSYSRRKPIYYKLLEGSVSDKATLKDVISESGISQSIALIDNGFESEININSLLLNKNKYIMGLKRSSKLVGDNILNDGFRLDANERFTNNKESIFAYELLDEENNRICIYFNQTVASVETSEYLDKITKNWVGFTDKNYKNDCKRFGIYVMKTNIKNFSLKKIYEYYKSRFEIEYMFDTIKNTLEFDKSYMHSDATLESWAFINHISILLTQCVYDLIKEKDLNITLHHLYKKLRQVKMQRDILDKNEVYHLLHIPLKTRQLINKLDIIL